jgi:nucleotide-binding universal stress UspA family protein
MIVVGSRRRGVRSGLKEFFGGSVAAQLAHRQHRPVVVVPVAPVPLDTPLPWE